MARHQAIYLRVSTGSQDTASQEPDLKKWAEAQDGPVKFYSDKASGKSMERPGWEKLIGQARMGRVASVVVWRLDRLGRTAAGLTALFEELQHLKVNLISLRDGVDLSTPAGRLMANVLSSVAQYETEVRGERVRAGQQAAKAAGKKWGGSKPGVRKKLSETQVSLIHQLKENGVSIAEIARTLSVSRPTVYAVLRQPSEVSSS